MTFVSYAQNDEDILLWRALKSVERGFYIDVGAAVLDQHSVSRAFYEHGWRGVNIEPVADLCAAVGAARPEDVTLCTALGAAEGEREFFTIRGTGLSTLDPALAAAHRENGRTVVAGGVPVTTLAAVCREHARGPIHFLKIDVEGAEAEVLAGADLTTFRPWIILLEASLPGRPVPSHARWEPALLASGYRFVWFDGLNRFYVADERAEALARHFGTPPNVWDGFVRFDPLRVQWRERLAAADKETAHLQRELALQARQQAVKEEEFAAGIAAAAAESMALSRAVFERGEGLAALRRQIVENDAEITRLNAEIDGLRPKGAPFLGGPGGNGPPAAGVRRSLARRLLRPFWRLVRPILRPLAWRARSFLLGPTHQEIAALRAAEERLAATAAELEAAIERLAEAARGTGGALETALLTLLTAPARPAPPDQSS